MQGRSLLAHRVAPTVFAARRAYYRARYGHQLTMAAGVRIVGRLKITGGTKVVIGEGCRIRGRVVIGGGGLVVVGARSLLNGTYIGARSAVHVGPWCLLAKCAISDTDWHNLKPRERHLPPGPRTTSPVVVGRNVWIGGAALVTKGVRIGDDSVVGTGAVVREDVPAGVVVAGDPLRVVKTFSPDERSPATGPPHGGAQVASTGGDVEPQDVDLVAAERAAEVRRT